MKNPLIALVITFFAFSVNAQGDMPMPDSATVVAFPWYDNNQYLEDFINARNYTGSSGGGVGLRSACPEYRYQIPVKLHVYRDNAGNPTSNLTQIQAEEVLAKANEMFTNAGTMIRFYQVGAVNFDSDDSYHHGVDNLGDAVTMFRDRGADGFVDILPG